MSVRVTRAWSEDIPAVVESLEGAVGLTGEDYLEDYNLSRGRKAVEAVRLYSWYNSEFLFGYPALCLLGPEKGSVGYAADERLRGAVKRVNVCINAKWRNIAAAYLKNVIEGRKGCVIDRILAVKGETEERFRDGGIDLVVEIVCRGNGAIAGGLKPYDVIFLNRGVVAVAKKII